MKVMTRKSTNALVALALSAQMFAPAALASEGNGAGGGNGGDNPALAYTPAQMQVIQGNVNLDYLKLTPQEVNARDRKLKPIYDYYQQATVGKVAQAIAATYGTNVYNFIAISEVTKAPTLATKAGVMDSAVRFYTGVDVTGSPFQGATSTAIPFGGSVRLQEREVPAKSLQGSSRTNSISCAFILCTQDRAYWGNGILGTGLAEMHHHDVYTSTTNNLFTAPVLDNYFVAMKQSNLKALDATVVFATDSFESKAGYRVIYPTLSRTAPIPQPVIFISSDATEDQIEKMLNEVAPRVFAYNKLFMTQMLPQAEQIASDLQRYPALLDAVKKAGKNADSENAKSALYHAFLDVNFALLAAGATAVSLEVMLHSTILCPILIERTIVIL